jgi:hypothetical protein
MMNFCCNTVQYSMPVTYNKWKGDVRNECLVATYIGTDQCRYAVWLLVDKEVTQRT